LSFKCLTRIATPVPFKMPISGRGLSLGYKGALPDGTTPKRTQCERRESMFGVDEGHGGYVSTYHRERRDSMHRDSITSVVTCEELTL